MTPNDRSERFAAHPRRASRKISYKEEHSTSDSEDDDSGDMDASECLHSSSYSNQRSRASRSSSRRERSTATRKKRKRLRVEPRTRSAVVKKAKKSNEEKEDKASDDPVLLSGGTVPRWQSLPYDILATIFELTCHSSRVADWHNWLIRMALLCKSFAEPALSALYYAPHLPRVAQVRGLLDLLQGQSVESWLNYRAKVKVLKLFAPRMCEMAPFPELIKIIALSPQLRAIEISRSTFHPNQAPDLKRVFKILLSDHASFREWRGRETANSAYPTSLEFLCPTPLRNLERLTIDYQGPFKWGPRDFAKSVNALPRLKHLSIRLPPTFGAETLSLLSIAPESLDLTDCRWINPDELAPFLATWGGKLRELALEPQTWIDLSFLPDLARSCPRLQHLRADFARALPSTHSEILKPDEVPTWPSSLRLIELLHLHKWTLSTADMFFSSLVEAAASLPDLRHIHIKGSLGESGWRSRVRFREKWATRFMHVFLRLAEPPNPHLQSIRAYKAFKRAQQKSAAASMAHDLHSASSRQTFPAARNGADHLNDASIEPERAEVNSGPIDTTTPELPTSRRSSRLKQFAAINPPPPPKPLPPRAHPYRRRRRHRAEESESGFTSEDSALGDEVKPDPGGDDDDDDDDVNESYESFHVQGLCDVVYIQLDNLRPRDEQLRESDFLDDEVSGDEDWKSDGSDHDEVRGGRKPLFGFIKWRNGFKYE